jgi:hypothetical protein
MSRKGWHWLGAIRKTILRSKHQNWRIASKPILRSEGLERQWQGLLRFEGFFPARGEDVAHPADLGADAAQLLLDALVASIHMVDPVEN